MRFAGIAFALSVVCSACTLQMADEGDGASVSGASLTTPVASPTGVGANGGSGFVAGRAGTSNGTGTSSGATQTATGSQTVNPAAAGTSCVSPPGTPQCEPEPQPWAPSK